jgi:ABC-type multidrug transport system ATPase subunit
MLALMGASGAGKTTLLNVLNYRGTGNLQIEGEILINGSTASTEKISMISSYIQQDYLFFGTLTG